MRFHTQFYTIWGNLFDMPCLVAVVWSPSMCFRDKSFYGPVGQWISDVIDPEHHQSEYLNPLHM